MRIVKLPTYYRKLKGENSRYCKARNRWKRHYFAYKCMLPDVLNDREKMSLHVTSHIGMQNTCFDERTIGFNKIINNLQFLVYVQVIEDVE